MWMCNNKFLLGKGIEWNVYWNETGMNSWMILADWN